MTKSSTIQRGNEMQDAPERMNDTETSGSTRAKSVQTCSLDVLAKHLYRHRPRLPPMKQRLVSNLIEQIGNYENSPDSLRPLILESIDRLTAIP